MVAEKPALLERTTDWMFYAVLAAAVLVYVPALTDIAAIWNGPRGGHCVFILPLALALVWLDRDGVRRVERSPKSIGFVLMAAGLIFETVNYWLRLKFFETYSLIPVACGYVIATYGFPMLRRLAFPILLLVFLAPLPPMLIQPISTWVSLVSSSGACHLVSTLGYPVEQQGNIIHLQNLTVIVADICSGFNQLSMMLLFGVIYGYIFPISNLRRVGLVAGALPVAIAANIIRISIILVVTIYGGEKGLHTIHDWAELIVMVIAFPLYLAFGTWLGCRNPRFTI